MELIKDGIIHHKDLESVYDTTYMVGTIKDIKVKNTEPFELDNKCVVEIEGLGGEFEIEAIYRCKENFWGDNIQERKAHYQRPYLYNLNRPPTRAFAKDEKVIVAVYKGVPMYVVAHADKRPRMCLDVLRLTFPYMGRPDDMYELLFSVSNQTILDDVKTTDYYSKYKDVWCSKNKKFKRYRYDKWYNCNTEAITIEDKVYKCWSKNFGKGVCRNRIYYAPMKPISVILEFSEMSPETHAPSYHVGMVIYLGLWAEGQEERVKRRDWSEFKYQKRFSDMIAKYSVPNGVKWMLNRGLFYQTWEGWEETDI